MTKEIIESSFQEMLVHTFGSDMISQCQTNNLRRFFISGIVFGYSETLEAATKFHHEDMCLMALEILRKSITDSLDEAIKN